MVLKNGNVQACYRTDKEFVFRKFKTGLKVGERLWITENLIIISDRFTLPGLCSNLSCGNSFLCFHCTEEYNLLHSISVSTMLYTVSTSSVPSFGKDCVVLRGHSLGSPLFPLAYLRQENRINPNKNTSANVIDCDELANTAFLET